MSRSRSLRVSLIVSSAVASLLVGTAVPAGALPTPPAPVVLDEEPPPVDEELAVPVDPVPGEAVPEFEPSEVLESEPSPEPPVFPEPGTLELFLGEGSASLDGSASAGFPVVVYDPADVPPPDEEQAELAAVGAEVGLDVVLDVPESVLVEVLPQETVADLGGHGIAFTMVRSDGDPSPGEVGVDALYGGFSRAFGGGFGSRLALFELPGCALVTPELEACSQRTLVEGLNVADDDHVSAAVVADGAPSGGELAAGRLTDGPSVDSVYVLDSLASGPAGSWDASPTVPAGEWQTGLGSGGFSYSYPLPGPPLPQGGNTGPPSLTYSSQSVDGRSSVTNNQASWVGMGWELSAGHIERQYEQCTPYSGDQCWGLDNASITLNGQTSQLVRVPGSLVEYRMKTDPGWRIRKIIGGGSVPNGDNDGEYWTVTTPDGTRYYFGSAYSQEDGNSPNSVWTKPVYATLAGQPCYDASPENGEDSWCQQAWRWNLDAIVDPSGNVTNFFYARETNYYKSLGPRYGPSPLVEDPINKIRPYHRDGYLTKISYGGRLRDVGEDPAVEFPSRVLFESQPRCRQNEPVNPAHVPCEPMTDTYASEYPDVPLDQICPSTSCDNTSPAFFSTRRLDFVRSQTKAWTGDWRTLDTVELAHSFPVAESGEDPAMWLERLFPVG